MQVRVAVADHSGCAAAADALRLPRAMVNKHVHALGAELGTRLIERSTRRQRFTEAGLVCLAGCRGNLGEVDALARRVAGLSARPQGML
jgi:DNA-binding transcriptional LysR family regulator